MKLTAQHVMMPRVIETLRMRQSRPTLTPMQVAYLRDMAAGATYSLKFSPYAVREILQALIAARVAYIPYQEIDGVVIDMVEASDFGKEVVRQE